MINKGDVVRIKEGDLAGLTGTVIDETTLGMNPLPHENRVIMTSNGLPVCVSVENLDVIERNRAAIN